MEPQSMDGPATNAWGQALAAIIDSGVKGFLLLLLGWLIVTVVMRRSSPARRHLVWMLALAGLLLLPVFSLLIPSLNLPVLPGKADYWSLFEPGQAAPVDTQNIKVSASPDGPETTPEAKPAASANTGLTADTIPTPAAPLPLSFWIVAAWAAVALLILVPLFVAMAVVSVLVRRATPLPGTEWSAMAQALSQTIGLRRKVRVLRAAPDAMPMTAGLLRAVVLLPPAADDWPHDKRRTVLLHELAHVKRWDCLAHALARFAVALHWFNPLAWVALRALRVERERACDDLVLSAGERPSSYAEYLLDVARNLHASPLASGAAIPMAEKSHLEVRLQAILDATRNRKTVRRGLIICGTLLVMCIVVPLSAVKLSESQAFANMTPEQRAAFEAWYTEKISIPADEIHVEPYDPALMKAVQDFTAQWIQHKELALEVEQAAKWESPFDDGPRVQLPDTFTDHHREQLAELTPLLNAWKAVVMHPDFTVDALSTGIHDIGYLDQKQIPLWLAARTIIRLMYAKVLLHLEKDELDEALNVADAMVAGARTNPYSLLVDRMIGIAILRHGIAAYKLIGKQPLSKAQRETAVVQMAKRRPRLDFETTRTATRSLILSDHIGMTMQARRHGMTPDFTDKTGYEIHLEAMRIGNEYLKKILLPQANTAAEKELIEHDIEGMREALESLKNPGGVKKVLSEWVDPVTAASSYSVTFPAMQRARAYANEGLKEYDDTRLDLAGTTGSQAATVLPAGDPLKEPKAVAQNEPVSAGSLTFRIRGAGGLNSIGHESERERATSGTIFVMVDYMVINTGEEPASGIADGFYLVDSDGRRFTRSMRGETALKLTGQKQGQELIINRLEPGATKRAKLVYEVPHRTWNNGGISVVIPATDSAGTASIRVVLK